jgi:hypothetical protein
LIGDMSASNCKYGKGKIDNVVMAEADDLSKWSRPIHVLPSRATALYLPPDTIRKARELVKRKRLRSYQRWLREVIEDRIAAERRRLQKRQTEKR